MSWARRLVVVLALFLLHGEATAEVHRAVVVLGLRPPTVAGRINPELRRRMDAGIRLFFDQGARLFVVTGGSVKPTEAEVMARYALARGVPRRSLILEPHARDTIENALFTLTALCGPSRCAPHVTLVTSGFHLERATRLFRCAGARVFAVAAAPDPDRKAARGWAFYEALVALGYAFRSPCEDVSPEARARRMLMDPRFDAALKQHRAFRIR